MKIKSIQFCSFIIILINSLSHVCANNCSKSPYDLFKGLKHRIIGGKIVDTYKYPWYALIIPRSRMKAAHLERTKGVCGGSLITKRDVITAAHCLETLPKFYIVIGILDQCKKIHETQNQFEVEKFIIHRNWWMNKPYYDIAMVHLKKEVFFETILLPTDASVPLPTQAMAIGFGDAKYGDDKGTCNLYEVNLKIYDETICAETIKAKFPPKFHEERMNIFCAGNLTGEQDTCKGDSGGPLVGTDECGRHIISGIVSYGFECGVANALGVYTNVKDYLVWIKENTIVKL